jgi:phenylacetic acid degradation operon negative regulatory protein
MLGFGTASSGVWVAPAHLRDATAEVLRRLGLDTYADLFHAEHLAFGDLGEKVRQWWDLEQLETLYEDFLSVHTPALGRWQRRQAGHDGEAFADYVAALTDWRRLPYLDPGLPAELLPADWAGIRAADLFFALRAQLEEPARAHVTRSLA